MTKRTYNTKLFGKNLQEAMNTLGMSQIDLSEKSGLTPAAVSQILNGKREPSLGSIIKILRIIPVKFEKLVGSK